MLLFDEASARLSRVPSPKEYGDIGLLSNVHVVELVVAVFITTSNLDKSWSFSWKEQ